MEVDAADKNGSNCATEHQPQQQQQQRPFAIKRWNLVATWSWDVECDTCAICRVHLMEACLRCQSEAKAQECVMFFRRLLPLSMNCRRFSTSPAGFKTFEEFKQGYERDSSQRRRQSTFHLVRTIPVLAGIWVTFMVGIFYYWHCYYTYIRRELRRDVGPFSRFFGALFMDYTKYAYNTDPDSP
uniref:Anaphase-promoting complex subunit 11 RING-H2 finger domain-containing protein n=2 Tax=Globodera rostochiensis TaxID=31243 RepID=A0A914IB67_GLORO